MSEERRSEVPGGEVRDLQDPPRMPAGTLTQLGQKRPTSSANA